MPFIIAICVVVAMSVLAGSFLQSRNIGWAAFSIVVALIAGYVALEMHKPIVINELMSQFTIIDPRGK